MCFIIAPAVAMAMTIASMAATVAGTVVSSMAAAKSGEFQAKEAGYQAQVAANNAIVQQGEARNATLTGEDQAQLAGEKGAAQVGAARAIFAASGVDPNSGSPLDVQTDLGRASVLNQLTIRNNAARTTLGYTISATSDTAQSQLDTVQGQFAQQAGTTQAFGSILSGVSSLGSQVNQGMMSGAIPKPSS